MLEAFVEEETRLRDLENQRTAWATAHIMNSSGNYRQAIQPTDIYKPLAEQEAEETTQQNTIKRFESPEQKEEYLRNLMKKFGKEYETDGSQ
jgi:alanine-alpha-ketoisovalerate/valine-pyruvate aminotransferase